MDSEQFCANDCVCLRELVESPQCLVWMCKTYSLLQKENMSWASSAAGPHSSRQEISKITVSMSVITKRALFLEYILTARYIKVSVHTRRPHLPGSAF